ncbi:Inner membrane protein YqcE [Vibrio stylophorae]|uniref:Inner membrane protein YqcE n=1 Tax=Vibrio stylophorae TaxID=659351 RepID=A0ABN8DWX7_9VIBR|nr:MFS transporter [Vibrio stylophorae]CAH0534405.1 Inner membrane protein YqcE [Vibrio stylophorae]
MSENKQLTTFQRYLTLFVLGTAAGIIYKVAYLREVLYEPLMQALSLTNAEIGALSSIFGTVSLMCYIPGGFVADKFKPKSLLVFSLIGTGLLTFWYATLPSYNSMVIIMGAMAITTILTFWSAFVKAVRILGGEKDQGKFFGYSEGIRAAMGMGVAFAALAFVELASSAVSGIRTTLIFYGSLYVGLGLLTLFLLPNDESNEDSEPVITVAAIKALLMTPGLWLVSLIVFAAYCVYALQSYTTPYMQNVFMVPTALVGVVSIIRQYGIGILSSPLAGTVADKIGSPTKSVAIFLLFAALSGVGLVVLPNTASYWFIIMLTLSTAFMVYGLRGIQFATMNEAKIPVGSTGAAVGIISVLGYSPDAFIYSQVGGWLDAYPAETAYKMIFTYMVAMTCVGFVGVLGILKLKAKKQTTEASA